ncbi:MAG: DNA replication/repair protein RecF [Clostridia bacterium]|nr:DNA replication/repair protein RecF [Clostridia bacterium]
MICHGCSVNNYRNVESAQIEFADEVNVLVGDNGQGKTNIVEAIYLCSVGRSFRGADEAEMIKFGESGAQISVDFSDSVRKQNITMHLFRDKRRQVEQNRVKITRMSDMIGSLSSVLFCPEHLSVVKEGPAMRRNYLDIAISQLRPVYISALQRYTKVLKQRNKLIRDAEDDRRTFNETIDFWSDQLAAEAATIARLRVEYLRRARVLVASFFSDMTGGREVPELIYAGSSHDEEDMYLDAAATKAKYLKLLSENHDREIGAGTTLWGIHKDDITINLNDHPARVFASQGQQRSIALAMKLSEGEICREERGEYPIFLLDDVLSELDAGRRNYLINEIKGRQVIMTTCETLPVGDAKVIKVDGGRYY